MPALSISKSDISEATIAELEERMGVRAWFRKHGPEVIAKLVAHDKFGFTSAKWADVQDMMEEAKAPDLSPIEALVADYRLSDMEMRCAVSLRYTEIEKPFEDDPVEKMREALRELDGLLRYREC